MPNIQYFLGGNTPQGFYSLYHQLSDPDRFSSLYIIKGGAGNGKSSLMRRVERHALAAGQPVEEVLCSGDPDSLDALILPKQSAALVDGTAPHVVEPKYPGVVERYIDLSGSYDRAGLQCVKSDVIAATSEYQGHYKRVYRCLGAAGELRRDMNELLDTRAGLNSASSPPSPTRALSRCGGPWRLRRSGSMSCPTAMGWPIICWRPF